MTVRKVKNKNGSVSYQASIKVHGRRLFKHFASKELAQRWSNEVRYRRDQNLEVTSGPVSIEVMFEAYLKFAETKGRSISTIEAAKLRFHKHVKPYYHGIDMKAVQVEEHEALYHFLRKQGLKAATCNRVRALVRVMFSIAVKKRLFNGAFPFNPFDAIEPAVEERQPVDYWNKEQMLQFLTSNQNSHYYPFFITLLNTGLRIGEAVALEAEQIDTSIDLLTIDRQFVEAINTFQYRTKGKGVRHIFLVPEVTRALYPILNKGSVFSKEDKSPLTPNYVRKFILPQACKKAGVKELNPHGFRHTFSAHYLMDGGQLWDLSKILGHSSTKITEKYYAHFDLHHVKKRMNVVAKRDNVIRADFGGGAF